MWGFAQCTSSTPFSVPFASVLWPSFASSASVTRHPCLDMFSTVTCDGKSLRYFVVAGLGENVGVLCVLIALSLGQVSVVTPLNGTAPLFVLVLAFFFLKDVERLTGRLVLGTVCIVLGVFLLTAV